MDSGDEEAITNCAPPAGKKPSVESVSTEKKLTVKQIERREKRSNRMRLSSLLCLWDFSCIDTKFYKLNPNRPCGYQTGSGKAWGSRIHVSGISKDDHFTYVEATLVNDWSKIINYLLTKQDTDQKRLAFLDRLIKNYPYFVSCTATKVLPEIVALARSGRYNERPFNFPNPSDIDGYWLQEVTARGLTNVGTEFTLERKKAVFRAIVAAIQEKLGKNMKNNGGSD